MRRTLFAYRTRDGAIAKRFNKTNLPNRSNHRRLIRQWSIIRILSQRRRSTPQLAADLQVTDTTIRRDLAILEGAGLPVFEDARRGRGSAIVWSLDGCICQTAGGAR
jgi:biotin operon repressor